MQVHVSNSVDSASVKQKLWLKTKVAAQQLPGQVLTLVSSVTQRSGWLRLPRCITLTNSQSQSCRMKLLSSEFTIINIRAEAHGWCRPHPSNTEITTEVESTPGVQLFNCDIIITSSNSPSRGSSPQSEVVWWRSVGQKLRPPSLPHMPGNHPSAHFLSPRPVLTSKYQFPTVSTSSHQ